MTQASSLSGKPHSSGREINRGVVPPSEIGETRGGRPGHSSNGRHPGQRPRTLPERFRLEVAVASHVEDGESERFEKPTYRTLGEVTEVRRGGGDLIHALDGPRHAGPREHSRAPLEETLGVRRLDY